MKEENQYTLQRKSKEFKLRMRGNSSDLTEQQESSSYNYTSNSSNLFTKLEKNSALFTMLLVICFIYYSYIFVIILFKLVIFSSRFPVM